MTAEALSDILPSLSVDPQKSLVMLEGGLGQPEARSYSSHEWRITNRVLRHLAKNPGHLGHYIIEKQLRELVKAGAGRVPNNPLPFLQKLEGLFTFNGSGGVCVVGGSDKSPNVCFDIAAINFVQPAENRPSARPVEIAVAEEPKAAPVAEVVKEPTRRQLRRVTKKVAPRSSSRELVVTAKALTREEVDVSLLSEDQYQREAKVIPVLQQEEVVMLAMAKDAGLTAAAQLQALPNIPANADLEQLVKEGQAATGRLVEHNLRLAASIARRFYREHQAHLQGKMDLADLIQEANIGLIRAVERYDYTTGNTFSTYATWWIRQAVSRAIQNDGRTVRLPVHVIEAIGRLNKVRRRLANSGEPPSDEQLAQAAGLTLERVLELQSLAQPQASLDEPIALKHGNTVSLMEATSNPALDSNVSEALIANQDLLTSLMRRAKLSEKQQQVLVLRFGLGGRENLTLAKVGEKLGITRQAVAQIEDKALRKLRLCAATMANRF